MTSVSIKIKVTCSDRELRARIKRAIAEALVPVLAELPGNPAAEVVGLERHQVPSTRRGR